MLIKKRLIVFIFVTLIYQNLCIMRLNIILLFIFFISQTSNGQKQLLGSFIDQTDDLLQSHVEYEKVHYQVLASNKLVMNELVTKIATIDLAPLSEQEQKAFYINAYNILVINSIVGYYPLLSIDEYWEFEKEKIQLVAGKKYGLNELKKFIVDKYQDTRLYFILADGTVSGAITPNFAYKAENIDNQIESQLISLFNRYQFLQIDALKKEAKIPFIFKKYKENFKPSVVDFINKYSLLKLGKDYYIRYGNDNRQLNDFGTGISDLVGKKHKERRQAGNHKTAQTITLVKNQLELSTYQSVYTITYGDKNIGSRDTYYSGFYKLRYGITGKFDIGVDLIAQSYRTNAAFNSSPFQTLLFERKGVGSSGITSGKGLFTSSVKADWALSHVGLVARYAPFKKLNFSFEQAIYFPVQGLPSENKVNNSFLIINQIYYYHRLHSQWDLFFSLSFWQPIKASEKLVIRPPMLTVFLNYYATERLSLYINTLYGVQWGLGVKFLVAPKLELNLIYQYFIPTKPVFDLITPGATNIMSYNMGLTYKF